MDLLPGPEEEAARARFTPLLDAHFGAEAWSSRLRADEPVPAPVVAELTALAGAPMSATAATVVAVELGRARAPIAVLATMVASGLESAASSAGRSDGRGGAAFATASSDGAFVLLGPRDAKDVVVWAGDGIGLASAPNDAQPFDGIDPTTPMARAELTGIRPDRGPATARGRVLVAGYLAGLARGAQDLGVAHASTRVQFGRPIGANQAVKHRLADCATRSEAAWATVCYAATALAEGRAEYGFWIAAATRTALGAADANARAAIQVHGGRGYLLECPAHLHLVRARLLAQLVGGVGPIREHLLAAAPDP